MDYNHLRPAAMKNMDYPITSIADSVTSISSNCDVSQPFYAERDADLIVTATRLHREGEK